MAEGIGLRFDVDSSTGKSELAALTAELQEFRKALTGVEESAESAEKDLDGLGDGATGAGDGLGKASTGAGGLSGTMKKLGPAVIAGTAALAGLAVGLKALGGFLMDSIEAGGEQAEVNNRQSASLRSLGVSAKEAASLTQSYNATVADLSSKTGVGDEVLTDALSTMNAMSQEAKTGAEAQRDLGFALAAAAQSGREVSQTSEIIQKAYNGEIGPAKELLGLTREQEQAIMGMSDAGERQAKIQELMTAKFGDQLTTLDPLAVATANAKNAFGDMQQSIGLAIRQSGAFEPVLNVLTGALRDVESWVQGNSDTIREWVFEGMDKAISAGLGLMDVLSGLAPVFAGMITYVRVASEWFQALWGGVKVVAKGLLALGSKVISMVTKKWSEFFNAAAEVADFMGLEFADSLRSASQGISDFSDSADGLASSAFGELEEDAAGVRDNMVGIGDALLDAPDTMDQINDKIEAVRTRIKTMRDELQKARGAGPKSAEDDSAGGDKPEVVDEKDLKKKEEDLKKLKEQREQMRQRNEVAKRGIEILRTEDEMKRLQLELNLSIWEIEQAQLTEAERKLETIKAIERYEAGVTTIKKQQAAEDKKAADAREQALAREKRAFVELKKQRNDAIRGDIESAKMLGGALEKAFEMGGASARVLSVIRAAQYAAEAIGLGAIGDFRGAIQAGIAAGQHVAIAAGAGGGGGGGAGGGGRTASAGLSAAPQRDVRADQERLADLFAEKLQRSGGAQEINVTNDFSGATMLGSASDTQDMIADGVERSLRRRGIDLRRLR